MKVIGVETQTIQPTGKPLYEKRMEDNSVIKIGRGEFMRLWIQLAGLPYPNHKGICCNGGFQIHDYCKGCKR